MFAWKDKRGIQETISKLVSAENNGQGANRRAINLVPLPVVQSAHEIAQSHRVRYHQLLVSIEAKQSTCCIRVVSETSKSREPFSFSEAESSVVFTAANSKQNRYSVKKRINAPCPN